MALPPGTRLGVYQITAQIGEGGMGEVYRASDTSLKRSVALKVLPAAVAADPDRLARFQREAELLAALNHPNIAAIYGLEKSEGPTALVMELVEGPTLADRIALGPIPLDEALPIAKQIADALEAAHEQGIVHRDLKPANIKVREDGTVKVLDFGLAKALSTEGASASANVSLSPTITSPAMTEMGMILGTAGYMAPEQARGKPVDKRADIWAFGVVLYEMLTGRRAFEGDDISTTLARVLERDPPLDALPIGLPPGVLAVVTRCLEKDPRRRLRDIGDVRLALEGAFESPRPTASGNSTARVGIAGWKRALPWTAAALVIGGLVTGVAVRELEPTATRPSVERFVVTTPPDASVVGFFQPNIVLSPDGSRLVYRSEPAGYTTAGGRLYVRTLGDLEPTRLEGTDGAQGPFFSPDGQWVAFDDVSAAALKKVPASGGPPETICPLDGLLRGGTWGVNDLIVFATNNPQHGLLRVSASGGTPEPLTTVATERGERGHYWPHVLPGARWVLFTIRSESESRLAAVSVDTGKVDRLVPGAAPQYAAGYLVYADGDTLRAVGFDPARHQPTGNSLEVVKNVTSDPASGATQFSLARDGSLTYVTGSATGQASRFVWVDRTGAEQSTPMPSGIYMNYRLSPDGSRVAILASDGLWVYDLGTGSRLRLSDSMGFPLWTRDGRSVVVMKATHGSGGIVRVAADGSGAIQPLAMGGTLRVPTSVTPDGHVLFFNAGHGTGIWQLPLEGDRKPAPLLPDPADAVNGCESPDGHWLAYESKESGEPEIYLRRIPEPGPVIPVSIGGGEHPRWSADGSDLFYRSTGGIVMVALTRTGTSIRVGPPRTVVRGNYVGSVAGSAGYDVAPDGRFLMLKGVGSEGAKGEAATHRIVMVRHWTGELEQRVPRASR